MAHTEVFLYILFTTYVLNDLSEVSCESFQKLLRQFKVLPNFLNLDNGLLFLKRFKFYLHFYLRDTNRQADRDLPSVHLFPKDLQHPSLCQAKSWSSPLCAVSHVGVGKLCIWSIIWGLSGYLLAGIWIGSRGPESGSLIRDAGINSGVWTAQIPVMHYRTQFRVG